MGELWSPLGNCFENPRKVKALVGKGWVFQLTERRLGLGPLILLYPWKELGAPTGVMRRSDIATNISSCLVEARGNWQTRESGLLMD